MKSALSGRPDKSLRAALPDFRQFLYTSDGSLDGAAIARLVASRNDRRVSLRE